MPPTGIPTSTGQASPCADRAFYLLAVSPETWLVDMGRPGRATTESHGSRAASHAIGLLAPPSHNASATVWHSVEVGTYHLV